MPEMFLNIERKIRQLSVQTRQGYFRALTKEAIPSVWPGTQRVSAREVNKVVHKISNTLCSPEIKFFQVFSFLYSGDPDSSQSD
jgi:hypothetical protein